MSENERRRSTAHEAWLQQLTPEQRGQYELDAEQELPDTVPKLQELAARERRFTRAEETRQAPAKYPCHRHHEHEVWCLPVGEMGEALQRAIERRD